MKLTILGMGPGGTFELENEEAARVFLAGTAIDVARSCDLKVSDIAYVIRRNGSAHVEVQPVGRVQYALRLVSLGARQIAEALQDVAPDTLPVINCGRAFEGPSVLLLPVLVTTKGGDA